MRELAQCLAQREIRNWSDASGTPPLLTTGTLNHPEKGTRRYIARNVSNFLASGYIVEEICEQAPDLSDFWQRLDAGTPQQLITPMFDSLVPFSEAVAYLARMDATLRRKAAFDRNCSYSDPHPNDIALDFRLGENMKVKPAKPSLLARLLLRP